MNKLNKKAGIVIIVAITLLVFTTTVVKAEYNIWDRLADIAGRVLGERLVEKVGDVEFNLGGFSGPKIQGDSICIADICDYYQSFRMRTATNTVCSLKSPVGATTTLIYADANWNIGTTTKSYIMFAKSADDFATTTSLGKNPQLKGTETGFLVASTSRSERPPYTLEGGALIFPSGYYLNVEWASTTKVGVTNFAPVGYCQAVFREVKD